jgi:hypothetical protein
MAGRAAILSDEDTREQHPCVPRGYEGAYEYAGQTHSMAGHPEGASFGECHKVVLEAMQHTKDCGAPTVSLGVCEGPHVCGLRFVLASLLHAGPAPQGVTAAISPRQRGCAHGVSALHALCLQEHCSFNGAWMGSRIPSIVYISSYFWDRATDAGG